MLLAATLVHVLSAAPPANYTTDTTALRRILLDGYDKTVPPVDSPVELQIRFFKIESIEARISVMRLKLWLRYYWTDKRLSWVPSEHGGVRKIYFAAKAVTDPEITEIWVPDITPYNSKVGIDTTIDASLATVSSSGRIFWSRPGVLEVLCRFSGLVAFPFDTLRCSIEIGGWALSGTYQNISLRDGVGCDSHCRTLSFALLFYFHHLTHDQFPSPSLSLSGGLTARKRLLQGQATRSFPSPMSQRASPLFSTPTTTRRPTSPSRGPTFDTTSRCAAHRSTTSSSSLPLE